MMSLVPAQVVTTLCSVAFSKPGTSSRYASLKAFELKTLSSAVCAMLVPTMIAAARIAARVWIALMIVLPMVQSRRHLGMASWTILPPTMVISGLRSLISSSGTVR